MKDESLFGPWVRRFLLEHLVSLHNDYDSLILERRVSAWQG